MLLDVSVLRLLCKEDFRVLRSVELGMRNVRRQPISFSRLRCSTNSFPFL